MKATEVIRKVSDEGLTEYRVSFWDLSDNSLHLSKTKCKFRTTIGKYVSPYANKGNKGPKNGETIEGMKIIRIPEYVSPSRKRCRPCAEVVLIVSKLTAGDCQDDYNCVLNDFIAHGQRRENESCLRDMTIREALNG